jgi:hypothetical protein
MNRPLTRFLTGAGTLLAAACASLAPPAFPPGTSMSEVEARMGKPRAIAKAPGGDVVWQYPNGPVGQTTYMVDFGADQRVKSVYQALTEARFAKIVPGTTTENDVQLLFGPPGQTMLFSRMNEEVWSYRYQTGASSNWIFNINFDAKTRVVRSTGQEIDPLFQPIFNDSSAR